MSSNRQEPQLLVFLNMIVLECHKVMETSWAIVLKFGNLLDVWARQQGTESSHYCTQLQILQQNKILELSWESKDNADTKQE